MIVRARSRPWETDADLDAECDAGSLHIAAAHADRVGPTPPASGFYSAADPAAWPGCALANLDAAIDADFAARDALAQTNMAAAHDALAYLAEANPATACNAHAHTPFGLAESTYLAAGANTSAEANSGSLRYRRTIWKYGGHHADGVNVQCDETESSNTKSFCAPFPPLRGSSTGGI